MILIAAANDLILVFLALEILSLSLYVLTGLGGRRSHEAAMKYFLLGAFSSAFFLYGVAMAYGAAASTKIAGIVGALGGQTGIAGARAARGGAAGGRVRVQGRRRRRSTCGRPTCTRARRRR